MAGWKAVTHAGEMMNTAAADNADAQEQRQLRIDLAAAFRLAAEFNWHESVANHFTVTVAPGAKRFLMNPRWMHFSRIRASDLLLLDADSQDIAQLNPGPDPTAWAIHGRLHAQLPNIRCLLHLHPPYTTALSTLVDPQIKPIDQNTARFYGRVAIDSQYGGLGDGSKEGDRLAAVLGNRGIMILGNHGVYVASSSIAQAFDELYYLERACQTLMLAYASGQKLNVLSDELARRTSEDWLDYGEMSIVHFEEQKRLLDKKDPSYAW